jgi:hypothetical protein
LTTIWFLKFDNFFPWQNKYQVADPLLVSIMKIELNESAADVFSIA